jgi:hypothetical protein
MKKKATKLPVSSCAECPCASQIYGNYRCKAASPDAGGLRVVAMTGQRRPEWCPLPLTIKPVRNAWEDVVVTVSRGGP